VADGEFFVLLGPSGCGKTTALRIVAGLEEQSSGSVYIGERLVDNVPAKDRDLAMVFQSYALYPHMTVYDNVAFGLRMRKHSKDDIDRLVRTTAASLGIDGLLARRPGQLSGGQQQRVALGRAIVRRPQAFLMDEPLSNLDAKMRIHMRAELIRLHREIGGTFIYVTHDQLEAMTMAERVAVLDSGVLQQLGAPQDVYDKPANLFVAQFIGSPTMNVFEARAARSDGTTGLRAGDVFVALPGAISAAVDHSGATTVIVGIRPEHLVPHESGMDVAGLFEGDVDVVESLGSEQQVFVKQPFGAFVTRLPAHPRVQSGTTLRLGVNTEHLHLFHGDTKERIEP
jgi:multiple sugar transport system ATP-binding protein